MSKKITKNIVLFDGATATATSATVDVREFDFVVLNIATASSANLTCKFQGTGVETAPTFSSAQAVDNHWDYLDAIDLEDGASIDGDTGFAVSGTDDVRLLRIDVQGLSWFAATITARSTGSLDVEARVIGETS